MLHPGDLIIFIEEAHREVAEEIMGLVIERCDDPNDDPAILIQFLGEHASDGALHYYDRELLLYLREGTIRIQNAS